MQYDAEPAARESAPAAARQAAAPAASQAQLPPQVTAAAAARPLHLHHQQHAPSPGEHCQLLRQQQQQQQQRRQQQQHRFAASPGEHCQLLRPAACVGAAQQVAVLRGDGQRAYLGTCGGGPSSSAEVWQKQCIRQGSAARVGHSKDNLQYC
jgi:hypothetical protein